MIYTFVKKNIVCKNHVWLYVLYTVLLLFLKRMFMLMRRASLSPKCRLYAYLQKSKLKTQKIITKDAVIYVRHYPRIIVCHFSTVES